MKGIRSKAAFHFSREVLLVTGLLVAALFSRVLFLDTRYFMSDESVYVYSAYAIARGVVPYRELFLAHPPLMFILYAMFIRLVGPNYVYLRVCNILICLATIFLTYFMVKMFFKNRKGGSKLGLLCAALFALYPSYYFLLSITSLLENILTFFTLGSFVVYMAFLDSGERKLLFLMGVLMGCAVITTFRASFFVVSIIIFHTISVLWNRKYKFALVDTSVILLGVAIPVALTLVWIAVYLQVLPQFYMQTVYYQSVRFPLESSRFFSQLFTYARFFYPFLITGLFGAVYLVGVAKKQGSSLPLLPVWIFGFVFAVTFLVLPRPFLHHLYYLTPYLILLSVMGLIYLKLLLLRIGGKIKINQSFIIASFFLALILLVEFTYNHEVLLYFRKSPYENMHFYIGSYVAETTSPDDKIWTSEGAIAFFAQRLIVAPNSTLFPFQPCFTTVFSHYFDEYRGDEMKDYKSGFLTINQFIEAWEKEEVRVVIFIQGARAIPYPDELLWNGFLDQKGASTYIQENYELKLNYTSPEVPYNLTYSVWVRR